jgi:hypothetical protein
MNLKELINVINEALKEDLKDSNESYKAAPKTLLDAFDTWVRADYDNRKYVTLNKNGSHTADLVYTLQDEHNKTVKEGNTQELLKWFKEQAKVNESVSIKEDKETMTIQKALKEIEEYYSDDELAEMDEEELRERLGETVERVLIYNEDVIDLWKAMWMESSASSSVLDEITSDVRSYLENEALEILKPKTKAE